ncbi:MAG: hypothetical protein LIR46_06925 [Bacteroidota bacterium]|nr:hypothetical protein [Bacteroidota bacterium]
MSKKINRYYIFDLQNEIRISIDFDSIDQALTGLQILVGAKTREDLEKYLQSNDCRFEIRKA